MHAGWPATAHLFIHNPFSLGGLANLFSTHPPTEQRVARLQAMASGRLPVAA
jgi:heat shock protein HtpX